MSDTLGLEPVTCASCEYRYPSSERICPMCGTEPLRPLVGRNKSRRARSEERPSGEDTQQGPSGLGLGRLKIPVVVVLIAGMAAASFFYKKSKGVPAKESGAAAKLAGTSGQSKLESAGERDVAHDASGVQEHVVARPETTQAIDNVKEHAAGDKLTSTSAATSPATATLEQAKIENAAERQSVQPPVASRRVAPAKAATTQTASAAENDPAELWKAVKRGSVSAELALANLYLAGEAVPQNCEQAHMLLQAASTKGSKAADNVLKSRYAERCE